MYFVNGVFSDPYDSARDLAAKLETELSEVAGCVYIGYALNQSHSLPEDVAQAIDQIWLGAASHFWRMFGNIASRSSQFEAFYERISRDLSNLDYVVSEDLGAHLTKYRDSLARLNKIVLIGHSQGNLYVSRSYDLLTTEYPAIASHHIKAVAVATPESSVAGEYGAPSSTPYTTLAEDFIADVLFSVANPFRLKPNIQNDQFPGCLIHSGCHEFIHSYLGGSRSGPRILGHLKVAIAALMPLPPMCPGAFVDEFDRSPGPIGNGWSHATDNINGDLAIVNFGYASAPRPDGRAGIYRPISRQVPVTVSARFGEANGFGGLLKRYAATIRIGSDGRVKSGYGVEFVRSDENYNDSKVRLVLDDVVLAETASTFQYGNLGFNYISVSLTFMPDGSISGAVMSGGTFRFSFPPRTVFTSGSNVAFGVDFADGRSNIITNPFVDSVKLLYACTVSRWNLTGVRFADGGAATGWFTFDQTNNRFLDWSINTSGGNPAVLSPTVYDSLTSGYLPPSALNDRHTLQISRGGGLSARHLIFAFEAPLLLDNESVLLSRGLSASIECFGCSPYRLVTEGRVSQVR